MAEFGGSTFKSIKFVRRKVNLPKRVNIADFRYLRNIDIFELSVLFSNRGAYNRTCAKRA